MDTESVAITVTAAATVVLAFLTYRSVKVTNLLVRAQVRPSVQVRIERLEAGATQHCLVVENLGGANAFGVRFSVSPSREQAGSSGLRSAITGFLGGKEVPVIVPGRPIAMMLEPEHVQKARETGSRVIVRAMYGLDPERRVVEQTVSVLAVVIPDGSLVDPPGSPRDQRRFVADITKSIGSLESAVRDICRKK